MPAKLSPLFTWRSVILDADVSGQARYVALILSMHMSERADSCFPSLDTLTAESRLGRATVVKAIAELERAGFLRVRRGGGRGRPNRYTGVMPEINRSEGNPSVEPQTAETVLEAPLNGSAAEPESVLPRERLVVKAPSKEISHEVVTLPTARTIVAHYVDSYRAHHDGADPSDIGRLAQAVGKALKGRHPPDAVLRAVEGCALDEFGASAFVKMLNRATSNGASEPKSWAGIRRVMGDMEEEA